MPLKNTENIEMPLFSISFLTTINLYIKKGVRQAFGVEVSSKSMLQRKSVQRFSN